MQECSIRLINNAKARFSSTQPKIQSVAADEFFYNLFLTQCHSSARGPSVSVSGSTNMTEHAICDENQQTIQIISPDKQLLQLTLK